MAEHEVSKRGTDLDRIEHKLDLLLRLQGLNCEQINQIVEAKDAEAAQQALIEKFKVGVVKAPDAPTPTATK